MTNERRDAANAIDPKADDPSTEAIREAIFYRGLFMHRHGGIEFALGELLTRARCLEEYAEIGDLPFGFSGKVAACRKLLTEAGTIGAYGKGLAPLLDELSSFEVYRNMLAHGIMSARVEEPEPLIRLRSFEYVKGQGLGSVACDLPMSQLAWLCEALRPMSQGITAAVAVICRKVPLPHVEMDSLVPHPKARPVRMPDRRDR